MTKTSANQSCKIIVNMTDNFITLGHAFPLTHRDHSDASNEAPAAHDN